MAMSTTTTATTTAITLTELCRLWRLPIIPEYIEWSSLCRAYFSCRRNKRNKPQAVLFHKNWKRNLKILHQELNDKTYTPRPSTCFLVTQPRIREIWSADYRDRIVHHLIYNFLSPYYEKIFIADTFACIKGRGTLRAVNRATHFCASVTDNWHNTAYALSMDISNFFNAIDRNILLDIVSRSCQHWLVKQSILYNPADNLSIDKTKGMRYLVPERKRLSKGSLGLPIGNLTSQLYANIYNNELDQFVKHELKCKYYVRYVDDFILWDRDRHKLDEYKDIISNFLQEKLHLKVHPQKSKIRVVQDGVPFVGYIIKPYRRYIRNRVVKSALHSTKFASNMSYRGLLSHANSYNILERMLPKNMCEI